MVSVRDPEVDYVAALLEDALQGLKEFRLYNEELERVDECIREALERLKEKLEEEKK